MKRSVLLGSIEYPNPESVAKEDFQTGIDALISKGLINTAAFDDTGEIFAITCEGVRVVKDCQ